MDVCRSSNTDACLFGLGVWDVTALVFKNCCVLLGLDVVGQRWSSKLLWLGCRGNVGFQNCFGLDVVSTLVFKNYCVLWPRCRDNVGLQNCCGLDVFRTLVFKTAVAWMWWQRWSSRTALAWMLSGLRSSRSAMCCGWDVFCV